MRSNQVITEIVTVDPCLAEQLLKRNIRNRTLDNKVVDKYANLMQRGEWRENYEPLHVSEGGVLLNGQHRLNAIIKSGISQKVIIIRGISDDAMDTYDKHKARTTADVMSLHNIENSRMMATTIKQYLALKKGQIIKKGSMSADQAKLFNLTDMDFIEEYENNGAIFNELYKKAVSINKQMKGIFTVTEMAAYMAYLMIDKKHPEDRTVSFFKRLLNMTDVFNPAIVILRDKLIRSKIENSKLSARAKRAYIIKAWNAYAEGREIKAISLRNDESMPEFI